MSELPADAIDVEPEPGEPKLLAAWLAVRQAELMLRHFIDAELRWPDNALYLHSCITALRSVTLLLQKALRHEAGFAEWYEGEHGVQQRLAADAELAYLKEARNYVLKEGALKVMWSGTITMDGDSPLGARLHGMTEDGPVVSVPDETAEDGRRFVAWREVPGVNFRRVMKLAHVSGLPPPPERDLREVLSDKVDTFHYLLSNAERHFDRDNAAAHPPIPEQGIGRFDAPRTSSDPFPNRPTDR